MKYSRLTKVIDASHDLNWQVDILRDNPQETFNEYWVELRKVLGAIIDLRVTGKRFDKRLTKIVKLGDMVHAGDFTLYPKFATRFSKRWRVVRAVSKFAILIMSGLESFPDIDKDKIDKGIESLSKFISIGDWISGTNP